MAVGSSIGEAFIDVKPRTDNFGKEAEKGVSSGLTKLATAGAVVFGSVLAAKSAIHFVGEFVKAAAESQKISRITDSIIKSTGAAAGLTAVQVGDLATSLSNLTGVDDELIQSAENILLTFTNVRNEFGNGNNIFDRTTEAALNMATVLGGDPTSQIQALGKALNDPAEGLTKLTRSGVVFTDEQKKMVEQLQASGDVLGAQKIILDELDKEFGGAAAAAADPFDRLTVVMGNLKEAIGGALIPVLAPAATALANLISEHTPEIADALTRALDLVGDAVEFLTPGVQNVAAAFQTLFEKLQPVVTAVGDFVRDHLPGLSVELEKDTPLVVGLSTAIVGVATALAGVAALGAVGGGIGSAVAPLLSLAGGLVGLAPALAGVVAALAVPAAVVGSILAAAAAGEVLFQKVDLVRDAFESLFGDTIAPIAAALIFLNPFVPLAVGAKFLIDRIGPLQGALDAVAGVVEDVVSAFSDISLPDALSAIGSASDAAATGAAAASGAFSVLADAISGALAPAVGFLADVWGQYGDEVTGILVGFRDIAVAVFGRVTGLLSVFVGQLANVANVARQLIGPAFEFIGAVVEIAFAPLRTVVGGALDFARVAFTTFVSVVGPLWEGLWGFVSDVVENAIGPIRSIIEGFLAVIAGFIDIVAGILTLDWSRAWEGISTIAQGALDIVQGILGTFLGFLQAVWTNAVTLLTLPFTTAWQVIQGVVDGGTVIVRTLLQGAIDFVSSVWSNIGTLLTAPIDAAIIVIGGLLDSIVVLFSALPGNVTSALSSFASSVAGVFTGAVGTIVEAATGIVTDVVAKITELPGKAVSALSNLGSSIAGAISSAATSAVSAAGTLVSSVVEKVAELPGRIASAIGNFASSIASGIKSAVAGAINFVIDKFNSLSDIDTPFGTIGLPDIPRVSFAVGGIVPGALGQGVPALVHGGEVVLNPQQQARILFQIANADRGRSGGSDQPVTIDARFIMESGASIIGVPDFEAMMDAHLDSVVDAVRSGRR